MPKLRSNHTRTGKKPFAGLALRVFLMIGILSMLFIVAYRYFNTNEGGDYLPTATNIEVQQSLLIPQGNRSEIVSHQYYVLGYNEAHEQADWVSYDLTKQSLKIPNVPRAKRFNTDNAVSTRSAKHSDYSHSGYTRGHMAPAGDMAFSEVAMQESFFMSNMSPQISGFNGGIWRELEESTRDWAYKFDKVYVASGPIFDEEEKYIGKSSKVRVPDAFYKIIIDYDENGGKHQKGIGFIIPHEVSNKPLSNYAVSIDNIEIRLKLDFFNNIYKNKGDESRVEGTVDIKAWPMSNKRYQARIDNWNKN